MWGVYGDDQWVPRGAWWIIIDKFAQLTCNLQVSITGLNNSPSISSNLQPPRISSEAQLDALVDQDPLTHLLPDGEALVIYHPSSGRAPEIIPTIKATAKHSNYFNVVPLALINQALPFTHRLWLVPTSSKCNTSLKHRRRICKLTSSLNYSIYMLVGQM
jgi:hypothetical protein